MSELRQAQEFFDYPTEYRHMVCNHLNRCGKCAKFGEECNLFDIDGIGSFDKDGLCKAFQSKDGDEFKFDNGKPRCDLVPGDIIEAIGHVRSYGVSKYKEEDNYKKSRAEEIQSRINAPRLCLVKKSSRQRRGKRIASSVARCL